jgi:hypothetical protein
MARRADPARIDAARRAGFRNRLIGSGMPEERADSMMVARMAEAAQRGVLESDNGFWQFC